MHLPVNVLADAPTLALIVRAKVSGDLPESSYDDAWDAILAEGGVYEPSKEVEEWMRANWHGTEFGAPPQPDALEVAQECTVLPTLARAWMPKFLDVFVSTGGNASEAARQAEVGHRTPYSARENDPNFAQAWLWAERRVADAINSEMYRRGILGWEETQFGRLAGEYSGDGPIGAVRKFDSAVLIKMATARVPEFRSLVKEGAAQVSATATASAKTETAVVVSTEELTRRQRRTKNKLAHQVEQARRRGQLLGKG